MLFFESRAGEEEDAAVTLGSTESVEEDVVASAGERAGATMRLDKARTKMPTMIAATIPI